MHPFFIFDKYSDRCTPFEVRNQKDVVVDAFQNPHTPRLKGECIGGGRCTSVSIFIVKECFWQFLDGVYSTIDSGNGPYRMLPQSLSFDSIGSRSKIA